MKVTSAIKKLFSHVAIKVHCILTKFNYVEFIGKINDKREYIAY